MEVGFTSKSVEETVNLSSSMIDKGGEFSSEIMKGSTSKTVEETMDLSVSTVEQENQFGASGRNDHYSEEEKEGVGLDDEFERSAISCFRYLILFLMISVTIAAGVATYFYLEAKEDHDFDKKFSIVAGDIKQLSYRRLSERLTDFQSLASTLTGLAANSNTTWPYFTDDNYPMIVSNFMKTTHAGMIFLSPIVHEIEKKEWSNYTQRRQHWIADSLAFQQEPQPDNVTDIFPSIFRLSAGDKIPEEGSGPFLPIWQTIRAPRNGDMVNFNMRSDTHYSNVFDTVLETKASAMTDLLGLSNQDFVQLYDPDVQAQPHSLFLQPVFKDSTGQEVVAILNSDVSWFPLFALLSDNPVPPVHIVVDDGCDVVFTMKVTGQKSEFVGFGDHHDPDYDDHEIEFPFAPDVATQHIAGSDCTYTVRVFSTSEFYYTYHLKYPAVTGGVIAASFAFMCLILYLYDSAVRMRQRRLLHVASRSEQLLSVLYPKSIRDRLFGLEKKGDNNAAPKKRPKSIEGNDTIFNKSSRFQLKSFMKSNPNGGSLDAFASKPIADLFLDSTVIFADICGFTAWSSVREPAQVFTLLESVYRAFDVIAKKRKVFKVETVGDCYVAVTGLPEPTKDHANIMASFAREIVDRFGELVGFLETTLGPDTAELGIRVGMHSGPITAGVLRGDKSRFQLFGDTVNTASRIESTGMRNRIQVSGETAHLIRSGDDGHLLRRRGQAVMAKGKGKLQTYWLLTRKEEGEEHAMVYSAHNSDDFEKTNRNTLPEDFESANHYAVEAMLPAKLKRLCQWNVDVLAKALKQIVAQRMATGIKTKQFEEALDQKEDTIKRQMYILDEVVEIVPLPEFDSEVYTRQKDIDEIELPEVVIEQMQLYVSSIALMYRKNPFHNFEHASHVTMSVSKLLSRIVAAEDLLNADETVTKSNDIGGSIHDHTYGITSDPITRFSVILAALIHDVDHSGFSNAQLVKDEHMIAKQFKNKSVAEQNSTFLAWDLLMEPRFKDFRRTIYAAPLELDRFRQLIANTVLATDIMDKELQTLRRNRWDAAFSDTVAASPSSARADVNRKATIVIEHLIQASDVSHTMQHWHIYRKWNERLFEEMMGTYKRGKMDKNPADFWFQGEIGFFDHYIIPLAKKLKECGVFGVSSDEYLNYAMDNRREWEEKGEAFVAEMVERYGNDVEEMVPAVEGIDLLL
ncbi:unnamed protein product [Cylindrotheca closterium]|uniref:Phosphodiesterase n=1 Tax=Cylindrotheca closterium TaxID=2856 RepID=A0AAD2JLI7_9STRA|nr:unnamed protein product [Cylindrotheca closterium]